MLYFLRMKNNYKFEKTIFPIIYGVIALLVIILVITKYYGEALLIGFPGIVLFPIYLTFLFEYKERKSYVKTMIFCNFFRFLLIAIGIIVPACIWNYTPWIKESTQGYLLVIPAVEILFVYTLVMVHFTRLGRINGDKK